MFNSTMNIMNQHPTDISITKSIKYCFYLLYVGEQKLHSHTLTIEDADRHKGGVYVCVANNGVGQPATGQVVLHVLCKWM